MSTAAILFFLLLQQTLPSLSTAIKPTLSSPSLTPISTSYSNDKKRSSRNPIHHHRILCTRRGGGGDGNKMKNEITNNESKDNWPSFLPSKKKTAITTLFIIITIRATQQFLRQHPHLLPSQEQIRSTVVKTLTKVERKMGTVRGVVCYVIGFALWEFLGLTTMIVEVSCGMVFGWKKGFLMSAVGKVLGALLAYAIGRYFLKARIKNYFSSHPYLKLILTSGSRNPLKMGVILRFSSLPEVAKNFGLSIMDHMSVGVFLASILIQGIPFSLLWSVLGYDSSLRLQSLDEMGDKNSDINLERSMAMGGMDVMNAEKTSRWLGPILIFVTIFGFVGSPMLLAYWINELRRESKNHE